MAVVTHLLAGVVLDLLLAVDALALVALATRLVAGLLTAETAVIAHEAQLLGKMMILTVAAVTVPWTEIGAVALFPSMEMIVSFARV